ncbi:MAG: A/G-specific adenine glycosylase [Frankiaceae bacterium]|jgi:A/G-specific adenine glycosylase|nr:A/G-specific adenine glycosylase [Frankiaceae bacterium]
MTEDFARAVTGWYAGAARALPWREPGCGPWGVMVSEFMLQQTPVARVLPVWSAWMARWPAPAALAAEPAGEAVRAWDRLGYPRRALRLHAAAITIVDRYGGDVPLDPVVLRTLPGVGAYTAAAIAAFAGGTRVAVLDTNVRRVYARVYDGVADAAGSPTVGEWERAQARLPDPPGAYSVAVMELGALVCTARTPRCEECPVAAQCRWRAAGYPAGVRRGRPQPYAGTDREVRGRLLAVLRASHGDVPARELDMVWPDPAQRSRALAGLVADGLAEHTADGLYRLPS